jgi:site-specific DNA recombinase
LESDHVYGVNWSGRKRSQFKSSRGKDRVVHYTPREEQVPVPVDLTGSGLDRGTIERARQAIKDNKQPSKVGGRFWELSGGILKCAHFGKHMIAYSRKSRDGSKFHIYYRCRYGALPAFECTNRKSHRAEELETRAWLMVYETATDPEGALMQGLTETYEERKRALGSGGAAKRSALMEALAKIETKRRNYWSMAASGDIPLGVMREEVAALDEEKSGIEAELEATKDTAEQLEALEGWFESLKQTLQWEEDWDIELGLDLGENEERRKLYRRMGINFTVDENGTLEAKWEIMDSLQNRSRLRISTAASPSPRA